MFVERGTATVETVFGALDVGPGDYVVLPRATTHRWLPTGDEPLRTYAIEASSHIAPPKRYLSRYGQFLEHAPYCERDLRAPAEPLLAEGSDVEVFVKHRGAGPGGLAGTVHVVPEHPFDVVGWDGCLYPYAFNVADFEPITGRVHQPPPVHQVFEGQNFVICNFVPRKVDYHPLAVPVPYYHSNVDSDEVMFYVDGDYEARKGSGIGTGSISLHPGGPLARPPAGRGRGLPGCGVLRRAGRHGRHLPAAVARRGRHGGRRRPVRLVLVRARSVCMTWLELPDDTGFGLDNLPLGVFSTADGEPRTGVRIGDLVLDLCAATGDDVHRTGSLNAFLVRGPAAWRELRAGLRAGLTDDARRADLEPHLHPVDDVRLHLPVVVADYVDFYSSRHHAENVGRMFRPEGEPLTPNWRHLPIGYHGRAGTVAVSGTPVPRPCGQRKAPDDDLPTFGPSQRLDLEAEMGFVVGVPTGLGTRVPVDALAEHVAGVCVVNDWSARDLQAWEYVPLGPFLGKSFLTSISPWLVPLDALAHARVPPPERDVPLLPHLADGAAPWGLDLSLEVRINGQPVSRPPFREMYWTPAQQLAHLTSNGASLRTGDLFASGTVSGRDRDQRGSLLELSWNGTDPLVLADGSTRTFLEDGDEVTISATAPGAAGGRICLGEVSGRVEPPR